MINTLRPFRLTIKIGSKQIHYTQYADNLAQAKHIAANAFKVHPEYVTQATTYHNAYRYRQSMLQ
jgi:hypothetical protein